MALVMAWTGAGVLLGAGMAVGQATSERDAYLRVMAVHFNLPPGEVGRLMEERMAADELPVVLFMSRESGIAPTALLAMRRSGTSWSRVAARYGVGADRYHVEIPEAAVDARVRRIHDQYASTPRGAWGGIEFTDDEVVTLIHLRVLSRRFEVPVARVLQVRGQSPSWIEVPARLAGGD
ncbi:MAG: hypothetical protein EA350_03920 [Gemmatimonadales bacterium]|nr:MAG: hypothetical protein EA350_03920 [Gemmatimonadales bacterium]